MTKNTTLRMEQITTKTNRIIGFMQTIKLDVSLRRVFDNPTDVVKTAFDTKEFNLKTCKLVKNVFRHIYSEYKDELSIRSLNCIIELLQDLNDLTVHFETMKEQEQEQRTKLKEIINKLLV